MVAKQNNTKKSPAKSAAPKTKNEPKETKQVEKKKTEVSAKPKTPPKPKDEGTAKAKTKAATTKPKNTKTKKTSKASTKKAGTNSSAKASTKKTVTKSKVPAKKNATKPKESKVKTEGQVNANGKQVRYFKFARDDDNNGFHGRVCGSKPKQAANKALTSILKSSGNDKSESSKIEFTIIECTRNSKHKKYHYVGERKLLEKPVQVKIQNREKTIEYKYGNHVVKNKSKSK